MKKKLTAWFLLAALVLCLTGCGSFEIGVVKGIRNMSKIQSLRSDFDLDLGISVTLLKDTTDMEIQASGIAEATTDPLRAAFDMNVEMFDSRMPMQLVLNWIGSGIESFISMDGGNNWEKEYTETNLPKAEFDTKFKAGLLLKLLQLGKNFQKSGTEIVHGSEAVIWSGILTGEDLAKLMEDSGHPQIFGDDGTVVFSSDMLRRISGIPVSIGIDDQSGMITKLRLELTEFMQIAMREVLEPLVREQMAGRLGLLEVFGLSWDNLGFTMNIYRAVLDMELYDFDQVGSIALPVA